MKLGQKELIRVYAKHDPYWQTDHPGKVLAEMEIMGAPTINVVDWRGDLFAIKASHRLWCAFYLGLVPNLIINHPDRFDPSDETFWDSLKDSLPQYSWVV